MPRFYDPTACPDCAAALGPAAQRCVACGLPLSGPLAVQLQVTLRQADSLLAALRRSEQAAAAVVPRAAEGSRLVGATPYPADRPSSTPRRTGLRSASVPTLLLSLGALCLLVAAVTFLAVAWAWLGIGGRTAVLGVLTLASAGAGAWAAHRGLRVAGESLSAVALGLLTLDVVGATAAGWLDGDSAGRLLATVGAALALGSLVLLAPPARLTVPQLGLPAGVLLAALGTVTETGEVRAVACGTVVVLLAILAAARLVGLPRLALAAGLAAVPAWLTLLAAGLARGWEDPSVAALWSTSTGPVLLLTALLPLAPLVIVTARRDLDVVCAASSALTATSVLVVPVVDETASAAAAAAVGALVVWAGVAVVLPRRWAPALATVLLAAALPVAAVAALLLSTVAARVVGGDLHFLGAPASVRLADVDVPLAPWLLLASLVALALAALAGVPVLRTRRLLEPAALGLLLAGAATVALVSEVRWPVVVALLVPGAAAAARGLSATTPSSTTWGATALAVLAAAVLVGLPSAALVAGPLLLTVALAARLSARDRALGDLVLPVAAGLLVLALGDLVGLPAGVASLVVLLVLGLLALARPRTELLAAAAALAVPVTVTGVHDSPDPVWALAVHLCVAGALVTGIGLVHARRDLAAVGGVLLAASTWVRLADLGVGAPEAYTLPSAVVLVLVGLRVLHRDPAVPTATALLPGLMLGTVPTLLVVLANDPVSLRAAGLGLACLALVLGGVRLRWHAPVVVGAAVGLLVVLRELAPWAAATPQWALIAMAGALLTLVGVTWERQLTQVRRVAAYAGRFR